MKIKFLFTGFVVILSLATLTSCQKASIIGSWVEPVPGMESMMQGVTLKENGVASSINMATLRYARWERQGDRLILFGESIGNHQTFSFSDTLTITRLTNDSLVLQSAGAVWRYTRQR